ncbi:RhoGEF domain-containing protein [Legionella worsleiensis]|uniref:RhoGEF domain protein n=1 Tax=Legionella worsleiensis TaxID=45076 RepID=A0A0W1A3V2_9GAMM|nr:RhoGEF domain-containing protein [Legionella worsleiensis]KTD76049.1 RhoGEF domain protein [Legionella worsleiensis]STY33064.1 RhoGEF domain [Legionella worsleiensis]
MLNNETINEMLEKEKSYQNSMELFTTVTQQPFFVDAPEIIKRVAASIEKFQEISESLFFICSAEMTQDISPADLDALREQRRAQIGEFFSLYKDYMSTFKQFSEIKFSSDCTSPSSAFKQLDTFLLSKSRLDSSSILIQPLQRGVHYRLFLEEALKRDNKLPEDSPNKFSTAAREQLEDLLTLTKEYLIEANKIVKDHQSNEKKAYQFGDITRGLVRSLSSAESVSSQSPGYKFGDGTRFIAGRVSSLFWKQKPAAEQSQSAVSSSSTSEPASQIPSAAPAVRVPPPLPPRELPSSSAVVLPIDNDFSDSDDESRFSMM